MLDRIWQKNLRVLRKLAAEILADQSAVEDVVQDALARVLSHRRTFQSEHEAFSFLRRTVLNTTIDYYRYRSRRGTRFYTEYASSIRETTSEHSSDPFEQLVRSEKNRRREELLQQIRLAIQNLPRRQQEAIEIVFLNEGKPIKEACREKGLSYSTVRSRMQAGLDRIRKQLKQKGLFPNPGDGTEP